MTNRDKKLIALGAGPGILFAMLFLLSLLSGANPAGAPRALAFAGILAAMIFPAFANMLRMRCKRS